MSALPKLGAIYTGLPVTPRMKRWGITSMVGYHNGWAISDAQGSTDIPAAVGNWLAEG